MLPVLHILLPGIRRARERMIVRSPPGRVFWPRRTVTVRGGSQPSGQSQEDQAQAMVGLPILRLSTGSIRATSPLADIGTNTLTAPDPRLVA
jgi:hypothetical protein